jgi:8-oxo-dGTP pyrophosphatase MutT (NUDIX family)
MRVYNAIGRLISPIAVTLLSLYSRMRENRRVRVLVWNEAGELLLLKNWIGPQTWELPGGGIGRKESDARAAQRELHEETGIVAPLEAFSYVTTLHPSFVASIYQVTVVERILQPPARSKWEISEIGWFTPDSLPKGSTPFIAPLLAKLPKNR